MANVLFVTWDGGGNVEPAVGIAREMARRGHRVEFLGHRQQGDRLGGDDFTFTPYRQAIPWQATDPAPGMAGLMKMLSVFADAGPGRDLEEAVSRQPRDLLVIDELMWGALATARGLGVPRATLVHTFFGTQRDIWGRGLPAFLARLKGRRPIDLWLQSERVIVSVLPELDPVRNLSPHVHHTGPVWQGRPEITRPPAEPFVLVSLSTLYQDGQARALQNILDALAQLPVKGLVTTGLSVDPARLRAPAGVEVRAFAPHAEVMVRASLVVGHGGHSTAMAAMGRDLPMLLLPMFEKGDQPGVAASLVAAGAALQLRKTAGVGEIRTAIERLLSEPGFRAGAARLGALVRRRDGAEAAADVLEKLLVPELTATAAMK